MIIAIEGIDGCGKTTFLKTFQALFGGSKFNLFGHDYRIVKEDISESTSLSEIWESREKLDLSGSIIFDRFVFSTMVYQGVSWEEVCARNYGHVKGIVIVCPPEEALRRIKFRDPEDETTLERLTELHEKYMNLKVPSDNLVYINGSNTEQIYSQIMSTILSWGSSQVLRQNSVRVLSQKDDE